MDIVRKKKVNAVRPSMFSLSQIFPAGKYEKPHFLSLQHPPLRLARYRPGLE